MAETVFYRPHMGHVDVNGTIHIRASLYDEDGHSSLVMDISPRESDYLFWRWVIEQKQFQRSSPAPWGAYAGEELWSILVISVANLRYADKTGGRGSRRAAIGYHFLIRRRFGWSLTLPLLGSLDLVGIGTDVMFQRSLDQDEMAEARLQFQRHQQNS